MSAENEDSYEQYILQVASRVIDVSLLTQDQKNQLIKKIKSIITKRKYRYCVQKYSRVDARLSFPTRATLNIIENQENNHNTSYCDNDSINSFRQLIRQLASQDLSNEVIALAISAILQGDDALIDDYIAEYNGELDNEDDGFFIPPNIDEYPVEFSVAPILNDGVEHDRQGDIPDYQAPTDEQPVQLEECLREENASLKGFGSLSDDIEDQYGKHPSWYSSYRLGRMANIMKKKIDDTDRHCALIVFIMKSLNISEAGCTRLIKAFRKFSQDIPINYKEMCKRFLDKSCVPLFIRKIPSCKNCRYFFDDTRQYCPYCFSHGITSPLYKKCPTKGCICSKEVGDYNGKYSAKELMCSHVREPTYEYSYYIPPIAIICDLIHNHIWDSFVGRTEKSISDICKYCIKTASYSPFVTLNTMDICKAYGMTEAASLIQSLHSSMLFDHSTSTILCKQSTAYGEMRKMDVELYKHFIDFLRTSDYAKTHSFQTEWLFDLFENDVYSLALDNTIDWQAPNLQKLIANSIDNHFKSVVVYYVTLCSNDTFYGNTYIPALRSMVSLVISLRSLYSSRYSLSFGNNTECNQALSFLQQSVSRTMARSIMQCYSLEKFTKAEYPFFLHYCRNLCLQVYTRYSHFPIRIPVIWREKAVVTFLFMVMRQQLLKAISVRDNIEYVAHHLNAYFKTLTKVTNDTMIGYVEVELGTDLSVSLVLSNIEKLKAKIEAMKGLDTQYRLLCQLDNFLRNESSNDQEIDQALTENSLLCPSFTTPQPNEGDSLMDVPLVKDYVKKCSPQITSVQHEVALLTISCDDVELFQSSIISNSAFVLEGFFTGAPYFHQFSHKNRWFLALLPTTPPRNLQDKPVEIAMNDRRSIKREHKMIDSLAKANARVETIRSDQDIPNVNGYILNNLPRFDCSHKTRTKLSPANWNGRMITNLVLEDIRLLGDRGIPIPFESTLYFIRPALQCFRFDNVAGNMLANSSGKQGSSEPCCQCNVETHHWNAKTNTLIKSSEGDFFDNKRGRSTFMSVLSSTERDDPLRLISFVSLFVNGDENKVIDALDNKSYVDYYDGIRRELSALLTSCRIEHVVYWMAPVTDYYATTPAEKVTMTNHPDSVGYINYDNAISGTNVLKSKDCMHLYDNLNKEFYQLLLSVKKDDQLLESLSKELGKDYVIPEDVRLKQPYISSHTLLGASFVFRENMNNIPTEVINIIKAFLPVVRPSGKREILNNATLNSDQKLHFTLIYSFVLFQPCCSDHFCYTYIRLFNVLGRMYAFRGHLEKFDELYREMLGLLHMLENEKFLDSSTINNHLFLHLDESYRYAGYPKAIDCFEPEWSYGFLKNPTISSNSFVTLYQTEAHFSISSFFSSDEDKCSPRLEGNGNADIIEELGEISQEQFSVHVLSAYYSAEAYRHCSTCAILTLWDIEVTSTLKHYLDGRYFESTAMPAYIQNDSNLLRSTQADLLAFAERVYGSSYQSELQGIPKMQDIKLYHSVSLAERKFCSGPLYFRFEHLLDSLNNRRCYGMVMDLYSTPHLLAFLGFFSVVIKGEVKAFAYCYEVNLKFAFDKPIPFYGIVQPLVYRPTRMIVDVDRIHPVFFMRSGFTPDVYAIVDRVIPYQYVV